MNAELATNELTLLALNNKLNGKRIAERVAELRWVAREATTNGLLPFPNIPAMRKTFEWVEAETRKPPRKRFWQQSTWRARDSVEIDGNRCGTAYCFAGHVADTAGVKWNRGDQIVPTPELLKMVPGTPWQGWSCVAVNEFATAYLGLTYYEASHLFEGSNKRADIRRILTEIFARAGEVL